MKHRNEPDNNRNNERLVNHHRIIPFPRIFRCDGNCFQRNLYQYPLCICHPISNKRVPPCSIVPMTCNPLFNYPYYQPCYFENIKTKQKPMDSSSSQVTVRQITPLHVTIDTPDTYRTQKYQDSHRMIRPSDSKLEIIENTNLFDKDYFNCDNKNIPSVPSKKIVRKNNGLQVSSTSFITTIEDLKDSIGDDLSENSSEHHIISVQTCNDKSNNDDSLITEQIGSKYNNIDEKYSVREQASQLELSHLDMTNELSTIKSPLSDIFHRPTLPSSSPPNLEQIKSNEIPIKSSRSIKSIPSLRNIRLKSSTDLTRSNPSLRTTRSTLDFGLLIDEIPTENF